ncbi:MAG: uroporphyrinogen-III synthase [Pseudomonadota bacterium]
MIASAPSPSTIRWVMVTRPAPDADRLAAQVRALGFEVVMSPVIKVVWRGQVPQLTGMAGLVFTSANGVRALCHHLTVIPADVATLPVYAVGAATGAAANAAGFTNITEASGDVETLAARIKADAATLGSFSGPLLHVAGTQRAGDLAAHLDRVATVERCVLYEAQPCSSLAPAALSILKSEASAVAIPLFSPRSARLLADQFHRAGCVAALGLVIPLCLSEAVAKSAHAAGFSHARIRIAARPQTDALCALLTPQL